MRIRSKTFGPTSCSRRQKEPDITAKDLLQKLDGKYPGLFGSKLLRTLQRRLVFGGVEERNDVQVVAATVSVAG